MLDGRSRTDASSRPTGFGGGFTSQSIAVDGVNLNVTVGGSGPTVVLIHGYAETSAMWRPLARTLAHRFTVIAPDLPGIGGSSIPESGLDMTTSAARIRAAVRSLGHDKVRVVGHDIGLMVAYAYAAAYRQDVLKLALMDAFLPGVAGWEAIYNNPAIWHFRFYGPTPEALAAGRERLYLDSLWNGFAADPRHSVSEEDRAAYTKAYSGPGRMAAGFEYFRSFPKTAAEFAEFAKVPAHDSRALDRRREIARRSARRAGQGDRHRREGGRRQGRGPLAPRRASGRDDGGARPFSLTKREDRPMITVSPPANAVAPISAGSTAGTRSRSATTTIPGTWGSARCA